MNTDKSRTHSFGQINDLNALDRLNQWLSLKKINRHLSISNQSVIADIGCGFNASVSRSFQNNCRSLWLVDLKIEPKLKDKELHSNLEIIEGRIPEVLSSLPANYFDCIILNSVLEHLENPVETLGYLHNSLKPGGKLWINVPNWYGKIILEFFAFKLGISPVDEMNDHKMYYSKIQLWPLLISAGFKPSNIRLGSHKFLMCTWALCTKEKIENLS